MWETILRTVNPDQRQEIEGSREFYLQLLGENAIAIRQLEQQIRTLETSIKARGNNLDEAILDDPDLDKYDILEESD
uniref:Uncharacterized protein n=1 Tax=Trichogramma kaykai TaxID=54128 RepID=A0ABD2X5U0_9HYME